ncbi:MAG: MerR family transcriptional regulator [Dehalobacterium sp.]
MSYKIGDISKKLNMPVETIRYYERKNIVNPGHMENGKYRLYETWDIFRLMQCMIYKSYKMSLKEVTYHMNEGSLQDFLDVLSSKEQEFLSSIEWNTLMIEEIRERKEKLSMLQFNIGNFWILKIPERYCLYYCSSNGDSYNDLNPDIKLFEEWIRYFPFVKTCFSLSRSNLSKNSNIIKWGLEIEINMAKQLKLSTDDTIETLPELMCISTIIDTGERGKLTFELLKPAIAYAVNNGFEIDDEIWGRLLIRTHEKGKFSRYFEILIPFKEKQ